MLHSSGYSTFQASERATLISVPTLTIPESADTAEDEVEPQAAAETEENAPSSRSIRASAWTFGGFAAMSVARLANNLFLSYLLAPELFGIMAIANIVLQGVQMCSDVGVGHCLIQSPRGDTPVFYNTAWTIQLLRGGLIWVLLIIASVPLARFYDQPQLQLIIVALGSTAFIFAAASTEIHAAKRHLRIAWITSLEVTSQVIGIVVMCVLAFMYRSVWSIVIGAIVSAIVFAVLSHLLSPTTKNRLTWDRDSAQELIRFGRWILVGMLLSFFAMQIDRLLLGKLGDFTQLGIYHFAFSLTLLASMVVEKLSNTVQFPVLASVANVKPESLPERALQSRQTLLVIGSVLLTLLFASAPLIFTHLYHENFRDAGWITQLMCFSIWCLILTKTIDRSLLALGDTKSLAYLALCRLIFCTLCSYVGYRVGELQGFCIGVGVGSLVAHVFLYLPLRYRGIKVFWQDVRFSVIAMSVAAVVLALQNERFESSLALSMGVDLPRIGHWIALSVSLLFVSVVSARQWRIVRERHVASSL